MPIKNTCSYAIKRYHTTALLLTLQQRARFWQILHINIKKYVYLINFYLVECC